MAFYYRRGCKLLVVWLMKILQVSILCMSIVSSSIVLCGCSPLLYYDVLYYLQNGEPMPKEGFRKFWF